MDYHPVTRYVKQIQIVFVHIIIFKNSNPDSLDWQVVNVRMHNLKMDYILNMEAVIFLLQHLFNCIPPYIYQLSLEFLEVQEDRNQEYPIISDTL